MKILKSITNALTKAEEKRGVASVATVRQDVVRRAIEREEFELIKCAYHLTDDYAWDAVNNFGHDKNVTKEYMEKEYSILTPSCWVDPKLHEINGVQCYEISISFHSNLSYDMYVPVDGKKSEQVKEEEKEMEEIKEIQENLVGEQLYVGYAFDLAEITAVEIYRQKEMKFEHGVASAGKIYIKYPNSEESTAHDIHFEEHEDWKEDGYICTVNMGYKGREHEEELREVFMSEMLNFAKEPEQTSTKKEKLYKRYDMQDESDYSIESLNAMKSWLVDFWNNNPDEEMDEEEHDNMIDGIWSSDEKELFERLAGIDYTFDEVDIEGEFESLNFIIDHEKLFFTGYEFEGKEIFIEETGGTQSLFRMDVYKETNVITVYSAYSEDYDVMENVTHLFDTKKLFEDIQKWIAEHENVTNNGDEYIAYCFEEEFVYICNKCNEMHEDKTKTCENCSSESIREVHKHDMDMQVV